MSGVVATSPSPRRVTPPSWLDVRLVLGVALVLASVVLGAVVLSRAEHTDPVVTAGRDLAAGTVLSPADLVVRQVHLDGASGSRYARTVDDLVGKRLVEPVGGGELVPLAATRSAAALTTLTVPLAQGAAPDLRAGQRIEVWLSTAACSSVVLLPDVTVQSARTEDSGFGTSGDGQSVVISVSPALADRVVTALAFEDAHIRAGILTGTPAATGAPGAALPDVAACAPAHG